MRIILKPGGIITLLAGLSLLVGLTVYTRISTANQIKQANIASSRSADSFIFVNQSLEKINATQRYRLMNRGTKLALDIWEKSTYDGAWTSPQPSGSSLTQQWNIRKNSEDGSVTIVNTEGNNALQSISAKEGTNVSQGTLAVPATAGQRWLLQSEGDYYFLTNQSSHLVLSLGSLPGNTSEWGVQQRKSSNNLMQQWQVVRVE